MHLSNAATINNYGTFDFDTDMDINHAAGTVPTFNNYATVSKTGGSALSAIQANFNNPGLVSVSMGELHVGKTSVTSGTSSGNYQVGTGATLGVSGSNTMNGTFTGDGGFFCHNGGATTINNTYTLGGQVNGGWQVAT